MKILRDEASVYSVTYRGQYRTKFRLDESGELSVAKKTELTNDERERELCAKFRLEESGESSVGELSSD